jgi:homoserine kinase
MITGVFEVLVPATLANLGSGFDALGVAVDTYLEVRAQPAECDRFVYRGEGQVPPTPDNLVHQGYRAVWAELGQAAPPVALWVNNPIPLARGMGSSSAALVAGAVIADRMSGGKLGRDGVFALTARIEGHPDNVAPAIYGGFVTALADPPIEVPTPLARAALPGHYSSQDALFNLARSALWPAALASGRLEVLREAAKDRLHQPYRAHLMPGLEAALEAAYAAGALAAFVGGAGPTVAAIVRPGTEMPVRQALAAYAGQGGRTLILGPGAGYTWKEI